MMITSTRLVPIVRSREAILACCDGVRVRGALKRANSRLASAARTSAFAADSFALAISSRKPSALALAASEAAIADATCASAALVRALESAICALNPSACVRALSASVFSRCVELSKAAILPRWSASCWLDKVSLRRLYGYANISASIATEKQINPIFSRRLARRFFSSAKCASTAKSTSAAKKH